jgi:MscS family membrane protein
MTILLAQIHPNAAPTGWLNVLNYEIVPGNDLKRFLLILLTVFAALAIGLLVRLFLLSRAEKSRSKKGQNPAAIFLDAIARPIAIAIFAVGIFACESFLKFGDEALNPVIQTYWTKISAAIAAFALAYAAYRLVDLIEYYLMRLTSRTRTKLDDMLVPVVRKALRVTITIIAALWIADGILEANVRAIILSAGVGGIAIALAAKDTIANFFGSVTIFADHPFQIDELVRIEGHYGPVEEVGFRSTKIRTLEGHLVTIPNSIITNSVVENVGRRPFIRRTTGITITYDSGHDKTKRAVQIIKDILARTPEINTDPDRPPRAYFSDFNDCSLNIYMTYWVKPPDYWLFMEISDRINFQILKTFDDEGIEFAFPTQTLYLKKEH